MTLGGGCSWQGGPVPQRPTTQPVRSYYILTSFDRLLDSWMAAERRRFGACHIVTEFAGTMLGRLASLRRATLLEANRTLPEEMGERSTETEGMELPGWGLKFQGDGISVTRDEQGSVNDGSDGYTTLGARLRYTGNGPEAQVMCCVFYQFPKKTHGITFIMPGEEEERVNNLRRK